MLSDLVAKLLGKLMKGTKVVKAWTMRIAGAFTFRLRKLGGNLTEPVHVLWQHWVLLVPWLELSLGMCMSSSWLAIRSTQDGGNPIISADPLFLLSVYIYRGLVAVRDWNWPWRSWGGVAFRDGWHDRSGAWRCRKPAGVTAYSFPPRKRAPAHKFASEFVHHPRKWAPRCSFSRGTYPRICSPRENVHHADQLILNLTALSSAVPPEQLHMLRWSSVFIFFLCKPPLQATRM